MNREPAGDAALLVALQRGSTDALAELYDRYAPLMTAVASRLLGNRRDAEDLVHDVFIEAWDRSGSYDAERGNVQSWLMIRLRSRANDRWRTLATARRRGVLLEPEDEETPDELMVEQADQARARGLLDKLDPDQREVVDLAYFEGLSNRDIAERCSLPLGTVKSRLSRAIARLREHTSGMQELR